jgi:hypothetical protein
LVIKRRHKRFIKQLDTQFVSNNVTFRGFSSDFSLNGLFIKTAYPLTPDSVVDIVIHLPDGSSSKIRGRVCRVSEITEKAAKEKKAINKKIKELNEMEKQDLGGKALERIATERKALKRSLVVIKTRAKRAAETKEGMGMEIIDRDANYLHLIRSLLTRQLT